MDEENVLRLLLNSHPQQFVEKLSQSRIKSLALHVSGTEFLAFNKIKYIVEGLLLNPYNVFHTLNLTYCTDMGIDDITALAHLLNNYKWLTSLNISHTKMDTSLWQVITPALKTNTTLKDLNVSGNMLAGMNIKYIVDILAHNTGITSIDLSNNMLRAPDIKMLAIALQSNTSLSNLMLNLNNIGPRGGYHIAWLLTNNNNTNDNFITYGKEYDTISQNSTLTSLNMGSCYIDEGIEYIADSLKYNNSLTSIDLQSNNLAQKGTLLLFKALANNNTLIDINVSNNNIYIAHDINDANDINNINMQTTYMSIAHVLQFKNITHLDLSLNHIDSRGATIIANGLKHNSSLIKLNLSINNIHSEGANSIFNALLVNPNSSLEKLNLSNNVIDSDIFSFIADSTYSAKIKEYLQSDNDNDNYAYDNNNIKMLKLHTLILTGNNDIGMSGALNMATGLFNNSFLSSIKKLSLTGCNIQDNGLIYISKALKYNSILQRLQLTNNKIDTQGLIYLASMLKVNNTLNIIILNMNRFTIESLTHIEKAIETNYNISKLIISYYNRGDLSSIQAQNIHDNIKQYIYRNNHNKYIKSLSLGRILYNNMTTDNMKYLAHYIINSYINK